MLLNYLLLVRTIDNIVCVYIIFNEVWLTSFSVNFMKISKYLYQPERRKGEILFILAAAEYQLHRKKKRFSYNNCQLFFCFCLEALPRVYLEKFFYTQKTRLSQFIVFLIKFLYTIFVL